jgi:hypothetical protein
MIQKARWRETEQVDKVLRALAYVTGLLTVIGLGYVVWILLSGQLSPKEYAKAPDVIANLSSSIATASWLFGIGLWLLIVVVTIRWPEWEGLGWLALPLGAILYGTAPIIITKLVPDADLKTFTSPSVAMLMMLQAQGAALVCGGALRIAIGLIIRRAIVPIRISSAALSGPVKEPRRSLSRQCWELDGCHRARRSECPSYRQQIACWRMKRGCYCDKGIAQALLDAARVARKSEALKTGRSTEQGKIASRQAAILMATKKAAEQQEGGCAKCGLYQEHQQQKCRIATWITIPAVTIVTWALSGFIRQYWKLLDDWMSNIFNHASLFLATDAAKEQAIGGVIDLSWVVVIIVGLLLFSIVMKTTEYLMFKVGL